MAQRDLLSKIGVKEPQSLTLSAAGSVSADAIDSQGFGRGIMFAINAIATISVTIAQSAGVATATIADTSGLTVGDSFTVSGANQSEYNITAVVVTIPTSTTFTYAVDSGATSPATGTIIMTLTGQVAISAAVAVGSYSLTDSPDNSTFTAVAAKSYLPTRKQTGNSLVITTIDANDSQVWQQGFGVFSNERYVIPKITLASIATGASITWSLTPILAADNTPFDVWDGTLTGDTKG